jgi:hypothetical protein
LILVAAISIVTADKGLYPEAGQVSQSANSEQKFKEAFWQRLTDDPVAVLTLVIAAANIALAYYAFASVSITRQLLTGAGETAERQLRAYVYIRIANIMLSSFAPNVTPAVQIVLKNYGLTPAKGCRMWIGIALLESPDDFTWERNNRPAMPHDIGPEGEVTYTNELSQPLTQDNFEGVINGTLGIFAFGEGNFCDAFGRPRGFRFRYAYGGKYGIPKQGNAMFVCEEGNGSD